MVEVDTCTSTKNRQNGNQVAAMKCINHNERLPGPDLQCARTFLDIMHRIREQELTLGAMRYDARAAIASDEH